jgi:hypothetical protein
VNNDGSFGAPTWTAVTNTINSATTTGDTVIDNIVLGIYSTGSGNIASYMTVPEPSTYALFGLGAFAIAVARRRRAA